MKITGSTASRSRYSNVPKKRGEAGRGSTQWSRSQCAGKKTVLIDKGSVPLRLTRGGHDQKELGRTGGKGTEIGGAVGKLEDAHWTMINWIAYHMYM